MFVSFETTFNIQQFAFEGVLDRAPPGLPTGGVGQNGPGNTMDMVKERAVRILLECILVLSMCLRLSMSLTLTIPNIYLTAAGSFSPETSTALVSSTGMQWEAMAAKRWEQNTFLCRVGFTCLTERQ